MRMCLWVDGVGMRIAPLCDKRGMHIGGNYCLPTIGSFEDEKKYKNKYATLVSIYKIFVVLQYTKGSIAILNHIIFGRLLLHRRPLLQPFFSCILQHWNGEKRVKSILCVRLHDMGSGKLDTDNIRGL